MGLDILGLIGINKSHESWHLRVICRHEAMIGSACLKLTTAKLFEHLSFGKRVNNSPES